MNQIPFKEKWWHTAVPCCTLALAIILGPVPTMSQKPVDLIQSDTIQAWNDYQLAVQLFDSARYDSAVFYYKRAGEEYRKAGIWKNYLMTGKEVGRCYNKLKEYDHALDYLEGTLNAGLKYLGEEHIEIAGIYYELGFAHDKKRAFQNAIEIHKKALNLRLNLLDSLHPDVAFSYFGLGKAYYGERKYQIAITHYKKSVVIWSENSPDHNQRLALAYSNLGLIYNSTGMYRKSIDYYERALTILLDTEQNSMYLPVVYLNLALSHHFLGDHDRAIELSENALDIWKQSHEKNHMKIAMIYNNIAGFLTRKDDFDQAIKYYNRALAIRLKYLGTKHPEVGQCYHNLGTLKAMMTDYHEAAEYQQKALMIWLETLDDHHPDIAKSYHNLGVTHKYLRNYDMAVELYKKALAIRLTSLGPGHPDLAASYNNLGMILADMGDFEEAKQYHQKALKIQLETFRSYHNSVAQSYSMLGILFDQKQDYNKAMDYCQRALSILLKSNGERNTKVAQIYNRLGVLSQKKGAYMHALDYHQMAIRALLPNFEDKNWRVTPAIDQYILNPPELQSALRNKAKTLVRLYQEISHDVNDLKLALNTYDLSMEVIDKIQFHKNESDRLLYNEEIWQVYREAAKAMVLLNNEDTGNSAQKLLFTLSEKSKAGILRHALNESQARQYAGIPDSLLEEENSFRVDIAHYNTEIQKGKLNPKGYDTTLVRDFESRLFSLNRSYDTLITFLEEKYPGYHQLKYRNDTITVAEAQRLLDHETVLVEFFMADSTLLTFVLTHNTFEVFTHLLPDDFETMVKDFRRSLNDLEFIEQSVSSSTQTYLDNASKLYRLLLEKPLQKFPERIKRLTIVPDGFLATFPFEVLLTHPYINADSSGHENPEIFRSLDYLFQDYDISYAYSAMLLKEQLAGRSRLRRPSSLFAGFAPDYKGFSHPSQDTMVRPMLARLTRSSQYDLPGARDEVEQIAGLLGGDLWVNDQATETKFKEIASQYRMLHLAMHGLFDDKNPAISKLLFTPVQDSTEDNFLHAQEIYATPVNADMVVLSSCNTGYGTLHGGEGLMSLSRAFAYAGCPSVVNSLWQASDSRTTPLMVDFYRHLKEGHDKASALQKARLNYLATADPEYLHPYYWSAFIVTGDVSPVEMNGQGKSRNWVIGFLGMIVLAGAGICVYYYRFSKLRRQHQ